MSYYAYDVDGYIGDVASVGGWTSFCKWGRGQGGEIAAICRAGWSYDPSELNKELKAASSDYDDVDSVRKNLSKLANAASKAIIISDGSTNSDDDTASEVAAKLGKSLAGKSGRLTRSETLY